MSKTLADKQTYKREQEPRTRKRKIEEEKANDFDIPHRAQLRERLHSEFLNGAPELDEDGFPNYIGTRL